MLLEQPVLFYSEHCQHSTKFMKNLMKQTDIFQVFVKINIDPDPQTRKRPDSFYAIQQQLNFKITEIPTIIVEDYILTGEEAFKWLESQKPEINEELIAYNPNEMGSFSDSYATFGSSDMHQDVKSQTFKFISDPDIPIETPDEDAVEELVKPKERENFDNIHNKGPQKHASDMTKQNRPLVSNKQKDFDKKLQELIQQRKN